jgi:hypothetical protein
MWAAPRSARVAFAVDAKPLRLGSRGTARTVILDSGVGGCCPRHRHVPMYRLRSVDLYRNPVCPISGKVSVSGVGLYAFRSW